MPQQHYPSREIIYEMIKVGNVVRVSAMDTASMTEIVISVPAGYSKEFMQNKARDKLFYVMRKNGVIEG